MAGNLTETFNDLCRLCASKFNLILGLNIFEAEGSAREINKKISTCLPIQVHEADRLPKMICAECVYKLETFFTFREKTVETENFFIELVSKESKKNKEQKQTMDIVATINEQQLIAPNHQELMNHSNISLPHIAARENIIVNQEMILNSHDNIVIHNHEFDNIEIAPNELNSHNMSHETIHNQQLLHHDSTIGIVDQDIQISEPDLNVQNLGLIHSDHALIAANYEQIQEKDINNDVIEAINNPSDGISIVKVEHIEDIKCETQNEADPLKSNYSEASDTEESSDAESDNGQNIRNDLLIDSNIYNEQNHILLNASEIGTSESNEAMGYYCNICGTTTSDKDDYLDHYSEHINRCLFCQTDFENLDSLKAHKKQIHSRKTPNRSIQSDKIQTRTRHKQEQKDKIDENFFKEESSDDEISIKGENSSEFMNENDEDDDADNENHKNGKRKRWEPKVCKECGKSYKTNYKLAEHMRKHTGETPYKCTMCDKAFRSKIGLAQHEAKHTGQYDYSCPTCGKGFQCKSYLIVHQRVHSTLKPYPCSTCGRNFKTKQSLLDHENRHLGVKPYMCDICGRGFITKGLCKSHQKVHSGRDNRQFPCSVCNKLFVSKSYLNTHVKIHTGEKPFICEVCGKGFLTRVDLKIHSTMHTGEKSFVCEICGKAFARRDALRCHRRSHTGERPYRCDICGQTFTQFSPMAIHKRLHTGERPYSCDVCRKTFVSRSTMMSHKKKHNPNETESIVSS